MFGTRVGPYRITQPLGEGGMGAVYEAVQEPLGRRVAIKVLRAAFVDSPEALARFFNEARAVHLVEHPGLVQVSDFGQLPDGSPYLVMELLQGETLASRLRQRKRLPLDQALRITQQLAAILIATHAHGIVHRDIKPSNVMLVPDSAFPSGERVKLLDFGIAKMSADPASSAQPLTRTGVAMGTPRYMSPEQCLGAAQVDSKSDVYSLGVLLFEMLSGRPPFVAEAELGLLHMHIQVPPPSVSEFVSAVPVRIAALVEKMLRKERAARPEMAEVAAACGQNDHDATQLNARPFHLTHVSLSRLPRRSKLPWAALMLVPLATAGLFLSRSRFFGESPQRTANPVPQAATAVRAEPSTVAVPPVAVPDLAVPNDLAAPVKVDASVSPSRRRAEPIVPQLRNRLAPDATVEPVKPPPPKNPPRSGGVYVD